MIFLFDKESKSEKNEGGGGERGDFFFCKLTKDSKSFFFSLGGGRVASKRT